MRHSFGEAAGWRRIVADALGILAMAALVRLVYGAGHLAADAAQALTRGEQLFDGRIPDYAPAVSPVVEQAAATAPTPHPLSYLVSGLATLPGQDAGYSAMVALSFLAFGALLWGIYRLGETVFGWPAVAFAALIVGSSFLFANRGTSGGVDVWFTAVLVWALVVETRSRRRGIPVLVLLGIAGLLRPDAWLFAGLYALYLSPRLSMKGRVEAAALVVAAPLLWLAFDGALTGDPLYSLTHTQSAAEALDRPRGMSAVPRAYVDSIREMLRLPIAAGGLLGVGLALATRRPAIEPMLAVMVLGSAVFAALGAVGLPLNERYLFAVAALLAVFAGHLAFGWASAVPGALRLAWAAAGVLMLLAVAVRAPARLEEIRVQRADLAARARVANDLRAAVREQRASAALRRCQRVLVFDVRVVPYLAYLLDRPVGELSFLDRSAPAPRSLLLVPQPFVTETFPRDPAVLARGGYAPPRGYQRIAGNRTWSLHRSPTCS